MPHRPLIATAIAVAALSCAPAMGATVDFESASDPARFTYSAGGSAYTRTASTGTGAPAGFGMVVAATGKTGSLDEAAVDPTAESFAAMISMDFKTPSGSLSGSTDVFTLRLGLTDTSGDQFGTGGDGGVWGSVQFTRVGGSLDPRFGLRTFIEPTDASDTTLIEPLLDTWYRLAVQIVLLGDGDVQVSSKLYAIGTDGTATPTLLLSDVRAADAADALDGDTEHFPAFRAAANGNATVVDNFVFELIVVPEPGAAYALAACGMVLLGRRRR